MVSNRLLARFGRYLAGAGFAYCLWQGAVVWFASSGDVTGLVRALRLDPFNAATAFRLARFTSNPEWLDRTLDADPRLTTARVERALAREQAGNLVQAELDLRVAAGLDRTQLPAWSLANFYLRRGDIPRFWEWARRTAAIPGSNRNSVYSLTWQVTPNPALLLRTIVPWERDGRVQFLAFLVKQHPAESAAVISQLVDSTGRGDMELLLDTADCFLESGQVVPAVAAWNRLAVAAPERASVVGGVDGPWLTDPDFRQAPLFRGFAWRLHTVDGVSFARNPSRGELTMELSGQQPETTPLIDQFLPLSPGRYRFTWKAVVDGIREESFVWSVGQGDATIAYGTIGLAGALEIRTQQAIVGRLVLTYRRLAGTARAAGLLRLSGLRWEKAP